MMIGSPFEILFSRPLSRFCSIGPKYSRALKIKAQYLFDRQLKEMRKEEFSETAINRNIIRLKAIVCLITICNYMLRRILRRERGVGEERERGREFEFYVLGHLHFCSYFVLVFNLCPS